KKHHFTNIIFTKEILTGVAANKRGALEVPLLAGSVDGFIEQIFDVVFKANMYDTLGQINTSYLGANLKPVSSLKSSILDSVEK
ncbi:hypothetical protein CHS0354_015844, partial [Potamilus streckersoni]